MAIVSYVIGDCPGCSSKECYGNVDVKGSFVLRGCQKFRYTECIDLPAIRKKVLYLDQVFYSLAFKDNDARFRDAEKRLDHLAALQLIVALYSNIHEDETHQWAKYNELYTFVKATSRGHEFKAQYDVEWAQLANAFEAWLSDLPSLYKLDSGDAFDDDLDVWEGYFRIEVGRYLGDPDLIRQLKAKTIDGLVALFPGWRSSTTSFEEDVVAEHNVVAKGYVDMHIEYLMRIASGDWDAMFFSPIKSKYLKDLMRMLSESLSYKEQLASVGKFLRSEHFRSTPCRDISARIFATFKQLIKDGAYPNEEKARKSLSGFFFDVDHISTYAPYCDGFVLDRAMAEIVSKPGVALTERYGTKIFSLSNWEEMFLWFDEIEKGVPADHKEALPVVYPWFAAAQA